MMGIVREEATSAGRVVPILQDLQGPKIRLGIVEDGAEINIGDTVVLTSEPVEVGTADRVHVSYDALAEEVSGGQPDLARRRQPGTGRKARQRPRRDHGGHRRRVRCDRGRG